MAMDNSMSLVPGRNPTGNPIPGTEGFVPGAGTSSGANPMLTPPNLPASAPIANPYSTSVVPTFGANSGGYTSGSLFGTAPGSAPGSNPISQTGDLTGRQQGRTLGELQSAYGEGLGALMYQFLQGGAGFNQQAINNLLAALQPGIERGTQSLMEQFSTSGNRFSSGAQIGLADYLSQVQLNEGQIESQMYEQSLKNYMDVLMGSGQTSATMKMNSPGFFDYFNSIITGGSNVAAAALAA